VRAPADPIKLVLASSNAGKLAEYGVLAENVSSHLPIELALLPDFDALPAFEETATTFAENALGKALHYSRLREGLVFADDSGLVVPSLGGEPGVRSARYAGEGASSEECNRKLLDELRGKKGRERGAYFVCAIALAGRGRARAIVTARVDGEILETPRGSGGFGYDPLFFFAPLGKAFAELSREEKNEHSHRGKAFRRLLSLFTA